ncbi:Uncharacterised protein [Bordetella pertussis]|nr:Uncharacterised protein [Bordetella pertussis]CFM92225.1 Uncharacterised protein [Bordetella pertussis]CFN04986.1 Uncharacterised protein [Bordetella pertussis]CFO26078.1 Uncharacterised protein [Bordetella pertussis]CFO30814.1 Uncharacterised protein [Bordetella pertussis]
MTSPGAQFTRSLLRSSSGASESGLRMKRELAPALPPMTPQAASSERLRLRAVTTPLGASSRNSIVAALPPRWRPAPPVSGTRP